jgi:hypothetical protein
VALILGGSENTLRADAQRPATLVTAVDTCSSPGNTRYERPTFIEGCVDAPAATISIDVAGRSLLELCTKSPLAFVQPRSYSLGASGLEVCVKCLHRASAQEHMEQLIVVNCHPPSSSD